MGFTIWAEISREATKNGKEEKASNTSDPLLGSFQAYDAQAKIHELCDPAVVNATGHPKTEIQVCIIYNFPLLPCFVYFF